MTLDFEGDAGQQPTADQLTAVSQKATEQVALEAQVKEAEAELKRLQGELRRVAEGELPELLQDAGIRDLTLSDGTQVEVEDRLYCSVPKGKKAWVAEWLEQHGHGALVEANVTVPFERGEHERMKALVTLLEEAGVGRYDVQEGVNTTRLKSLLKELLDDGEQPPLSEFGAYQRRFTTVKRP